MLQQVRDQSLPLHLQAHVLTTHYPTRQVSTVFTLYNVHGKYIEVESGKGGCSREEEGEQLLTNAVILFTIPKHEVICSATLDA